MTLERVLTEGPIIHNYKYTYHLVKGVSNAETPILVYCIKCKRDWQTTPRQHISLKRGCIVCKNNKYTLETLMETLLRLDPHNQFDYSEITSAHVKNTKSLIPITCMWCKNPFRWITSIASHLKHRCPQCSKHVWTQDRLTSTIIQLFGPDKFDLSFITDDPERPKHKTFILKCNDCHFKWTAHINTHINNREGCPNCNNCARWTYERFLFCVERHPKKSLIDYSLVTPDHVQGKDSRIPLRCIQHKHSWSPNIYKHFKLGFGCPQCAENSKWTRDQVIEKSRCIFGNKFTYDRVIDVQNLNSLIVLFCKECEHYFQRSVQSHLDGNGCSYCADYVFWNLDLFLHHAKKVHGDMYSYDLVTEQHISGHRSLVPIKCLKFGHLFSQSISSHIRNKCGCPHCKSSKGERQCAAILESKNLSFIAQFRLQSLPNRRFDFQFVTNGHSFLIEIDGVQHFAYTPYFHKTQQEFVRRQAIDIAKTQASIAASVCLIRIDKASFKDMELHIDAALAKPSPVYFSNPAMYQFIIHKIIPPF